MLQSNTEKHDPTTQGTSQTFMVETQLNKENSSQNFEREQLEGSPMELITLENGNSFIVLGQTRLTDFHEKQYLKELYKAKDWNLIGAFVAGIIEAIDREKIKEDWNLNNQ